MSSCIDAQWYLAKCLLNSLQIDVNYCINSAKKSATIFVNNELNVPTYKLWLEASKDRVQDVSHLSTHFTNVVNTFGETLHAADKSVGISLKHQYFLRDKSDIFGELLFLSSAYTQWHVAKWLLCVPQVDMNYTDSNGNVVISILLDDFDVLGHRFAQAAGEWSYGRSQSIVKTLY